MAVTQAQITIPSNGSLVQLFSRQAVNSSSLNIRNTGTVTVLLGPPTFQLPPPNFLATVATLAAPTGVTATPVAGGGTFTAATYYWKVTALNSFGETIGSSEASAAVAANGHVTVSWTAVSGATGYNVYRSVTAGGESTSPARVASNVSGTTFSDTGVVPTAGSVPAFNTAWTTTGTFAAGTYYYQITALNAVGESIPSGEHAATVITNGSVILTWTQVPTATGYKIYRSTTSLGETTSPALLTIIGSGSTVTYTDTGGAVSTGAAPTTNTASLPVLFPLASNEYLGVEVDNEDVLMAQVQTAGTAGQITILGV